MGDSQTGEQSYHRHAPTGVRALEFHTSSSLEVWHLSPRAWLRPVWLDDSSSTGLGEIEALLLEEAAQVSCLTGPRRKVLTPQDPGPDLLAGLGGFRGGGGGGVGKLWFTMGTRTLVQEVPGSNYQQALPEGGHFGPKTGLTQQPAGSSAGCLRARQ